MSSPKFLVFKLKDLRIPALIILIGVALFAFFMLRSKTTPTFSPSAGFQDGKYIAGITLSDAEMDVVVEVTNNTITSVSLSGLDETSSTLYSDLVSSMDYINTYVTTTQSLELPTDGKTTTATMLLMDAVKIALSDDANASVTNTYQKVELTDAQPLAPETNDSEAANEIFVDEFQEEDFISEEAAPASADLSAKEAAPAEQ